MSKGKSKKSSKKGKRGKKQNVVLTSLSKKEPSSNWISFMKSQGTNKTMFKIQNNMEMKVEKVKEIKQPALTKVVALDCEMVSDLDNQDMLARVSLVNYKLETIYDKYVKPTEKVGDYRTRFSGIREKDLEKGEDFNIVQQEVKNMLFNKILVGHALHNDFKVLKFGHHKQLIRDTSRYGAFREVSNSVSPSLKKLAKVFLNENVQEGEHSSVEDAKCAMKLYKKFRQEWEMSLINNKSKLQQRTLTEPPQIT